MLIFWESHNDPNFEKSPPKLKFVRNYRLDSFHEHVNQKKSRFRIVLNLKSKKLGFSITILLVKIAKVFLIPIHFDFRKPVSPKLLIWFFSGSSLKIPYLCWKKNDSVWLVQWNFDGPETLESAVSLSMPRYSNSCFLSSTCFIFPSGCRSTDFYEANYPVL